MRRRDFLSGLAAICAAPFSSHLRRPNVQGQWSHCMSFVPVKHRVDEVKKLEGKCEIWLDGVKVENGDKILVWRDPNPCQNGIYEFQGNPEWERRSLDREWGDILKRSV